jgi:hypothetical protein
MVRATYKLGPHKPHEVQEVFTGILYTLELFKPVLQTQDLGFRIVGISH